jgi:hypothetical protein
MALMKKNVLKGIVRNSISPVRSTVPVLPTSKINFNGAKMVKKSLPERSTLPITAPKPALVRPRPKNFSRKFF